MHLATRSYVLVALAAVIAIAGIWSSDPQLAPLWRIPAGMLLLGLAVEGLWVRRRQPAVRIDTATPAFLGRSQRGAFVFANGSARPLILEYAVASPPGFEAAPEVRRLTVPAHATLADGVPLLPVGLGPQPWPPLPPGPPLATRPGRSGPSQGGQRSGPSVQQRLIHCRPHADVG